MDSFREVFDLACQYCQKELSEVAYNLWIKDIEPVRFEGSVAYLFVRSAFKKSIVEEKYLDLLKKSFEKALGFEVEVSLSCEESGPAPAPQAQPAPTAQPSAAAAAAAAAPSSPPPVQEPEEALGSTDETFDTFIVGPSNKFAHAASCAVANNPAKAYNPLFIYGGSGLGKTHPEFNIVYVKGEDFTNELIRAIGGKNTQQFHDKYRVADLLAVDDIQFIGGKESTQEEFFHTFNALYQAGKQIILTSDRPPKEIKTLEDRLRTRFEWGLLADIQPPDFETRVAIIQRKAEMMNIEIPDDVAEYIANRLKNNIRQLEGAVKKLKAYKQLAGSNPSILIAQSAIKDILSDHQPIPMTVERIITEVARTYGVTAEDIRSVKRASAISTARQVSMYIVREVTQMSMATIGDEFGNRDHSTVVYAIQQVQKNMQKDQHFKETVDDIIKNIQTL